MLDVEDMFFHGISFTNWQYVGISYMELVESVLKDGFLFTRNSLEDKHPLLCNCLNYHSCNGHNRVSVCCHPTKNDFYVDQKKDKYFYWWDVEAFGTFVYSDLSIVLDKNILDGSIFQKGPMKGEFQICGDISLKNMKRLGFPNFFERICKEIEIILEKEDFLRYRTDYYVERLRWAKDMVTFLDNGYCGLGYKELEQVKILLSKYRYDVPIIDPETGIEWSSREETQERVEFIRDLAVRKRLIKI